MPSQQIEQAAINKIQISTFKENKTKNVANLKPTPPTLAVVIILHMGPHPPRHGGSGWAAATPPIQHLVRELEAKGMGQTTNNNVNVHNTRGSILQCPLYQYDAIFIRVYARPLCYIKYEDKNELYWAIICSVSYTHLTLPTILRV